MDTHQTSQRKKDHIELAFLSQISGNDTRFNYEPLMAPHPNKAIPEASLAGKTMRLPIWISSMTGGTAMAKTINQNLAKACAEFGMGLGLGSCRILLHSQEHLKDFDVRHLMGDQPLFANLGIAQIEHLIAEGQLAQVRTLVQQLQADGLIIHINPLQEWLQPEGDVIRQAPIDTIKRFLDAMDCKVIVKEVGQGFGPQSMKALLELPLEAIEFAAHGGTNFSAIELHRQTDLAQQQWIPVQHIGHNAGEMLDNLNQLYETMGSERLCKQVIISGGIRHFMDGYYLTQKSKLPAMYGQASAFLKYATGDYETLQAFCQLQEKGLALCHQYLSIK